MEWTLSIILYTLLAAGVAAVLRLWDFPSDKLTTTDPVKIGYTFIGSTAAAFMTVFFGNGRILPDDPYMFAMVAGAAIGGMTAVRAGFEKYKGGSSQAATVTEPKTGL